MFVYHNVEPDRREINDCVIRAMQLGLDIPYFDIVDLLYKNGVNNCCDTLNIECYEKLLDDYFGLLHYFVSNKTVAEIVDEHNNHILIIRIDGHLTVGMFGNIHDIWDCSDEEVTDFWVVY